MYRKTSIIITSYNTLELLQMCIESIRAFTDFGTYEIIVVDNDSTDGSVEWLQMQDDIRCIFNEKNVDSPKGCNKGMEFAKGDSILLLNSDTIVTPRWLNQLKTALYSSDDIGAVGCVTNKCSNYQEIEVLYTDIDNMLTFAEEYNHSNPDKWVESFKLASFCMLFKRKIYDELSSLDESLGSKNFAEDDYSLRMRLAGYRLIICRDTFVYNFNNIFGLRKIPGEKEQISRENYIRLLRNDCLKFCNKWNINIKYNSIDSIVNYLNEKFRNNARVLFIGSYSMQELFILHSKRPNIQLEYITDNKLDWKTQPNFVKQYNCTDILHEAHKSLSGTYDFIVIDEGIVKYDNAINFIALLAKHVENINDIYMRKYKLLLTSSYTKCTEKNKICFITLVNNENTYAKALNNWKTLKIPNGMVVEYIAIRGAKSMTEGCNTGMLQSDAKYKIYIHQDVYFENNNFLKILINSFKNNKNYGIAGVVGCKKLPTSCVWWWAKEKVGGIRDTNVDSGIPIRYFYQDKLSKPVEVSGLDGLILATQYDIPWRSDIFDKWHFYDMSQCMEFKRHGYNAIVLPQLDVLCFHDCGVPSVEGYDEERIKFLNEYLVELADE